MFEQDIFIPMNTNISPFSPNSNCISNHSKGSSLVIAHKQSITVVNFSDSLKSEPSSQFLTISSDVENDEEEEVITQARIVNFEENLLIIVVTSRFLKVYSKEEHSLIFNFSLNDLNETLPSTCLQSSAKGVALFASTLYVGHSSGSILLFALSLEDDKVKVDQMPLEVSLNGHSESITDLDSNERYLASSDAGGSIFIWEMENETPQVWVRFDSTNGFPFTCIKLFNDKIIAGQSTGHLRLYDIPLRRMSCEIMAHSKWITSIDVCLQSKMMISASEDTFIRLWNLKDDPMEWISLHSSFRIPNTLLIGSAFLDPQGDAFTAAGYDSKQLYCFKRLH